MLAVGLTMLALLVRLLLSFVLDMNVPYLVSFFAVMATAIFAGFYPALLATVVSAVGVNYFIMAPVFRLNFAMSTSDMVGFVLFVLVGASIAWLGGARLKVFEQLRETAEALRERELQLRSLTDNLPGAMTYQVEREPNGASRFLYVSANVERLNGVTPHDVYADANALYGAILPSYLPSLLEAEEHCVRTGTPFEVEVPMRHSNGSVRWFHISSSVRTLPGGRQVWDGVQFDVTERHEAQEALRRLNAELEERVRERTAQLARSNQELEQFAYVASHDLKAPLRTITSYLQLLQLRYEGRLDEKADMYITFSVAAAEWMNVLIDDLLAYARIGRERKAEPVDAQVVLGNVVESLQDSLRQSGGRVEVAALPTILADETQFRQMMQNLVENALKFRSETRAPVVHVSASVEDGMAHFEVADNGIGIDGAYFDKIFQVFQRLHRREDFLGSGVGLAIVKRVVEEHGGRIWVKSEVGVGTTFHFTFPVAPARSESALQRRQM
ncbi:sensor histidine kinase [Deinococcus yavapaiensis]|uniref:histidine kinase n=1 Tax=Deinococcus yavapaiensis KR-236 TaxID=694435 RepID=A0A318SBD4_9DEIO|nr:ATP-binding protein [Deinococcus yavapaiensis]PYE55674.1 PAS domain S-box-containing protein [Deinococcus yavapaiensis KR-236]